MAEATDPPTVEEFAARHKPNLSLSDILDGRPELWDDVVRLRSTYRLAWPAVIEYLALQGVQTSTSTVREQWRKRQTP